MDPKTFPPCVKDALIFPLVEALFGRRARRFSLGASLPDGPLAFTSQHDPLPLTELEQMMVLTAAAGNTGWHFSITRNAHYAPHLANDHHFGPGAYLSSHARHMANWHT